MEEGVAAEEAHDMVTSKADDQSPDGTAEQCCHQAFRSSHPPGISSQAQRPQDQHAEWPRMSRMFQSSRSQKDLNATHVARTLRT